jgi:heme A synthase
MRVFDVSVALLIVLVTLAFWWRRIRLNERVTTERALILKGLILGVLIGMIFAFLSSGNIWTSIHLK